VRFPAPLTYSRSKRYLPPGPHPLTGVVNSSVALAPDYFFVRRLPMLIEGDCESVNNDPGSEPRRDSRQVRNPT